jgi:hypothetical protein
MWYVLALVIGALSTPALSINLSVGGHAKCTIVIASEATPAESFAAEELVDYLKQVTGATVPVATEDKKVTGPRIVIGPNHLSRSLLGREVVDQLGAEEFVIQTKGNDLLLVGGRPRGTPYAVYHFLDDIVGIRWWAPGATYIPKNPELRVDSLNIRYTPAFAYRDVFITTAWDPDWAARNRLNSRVLNMKPGGDLLVTPDARHGGGVVYNAGFVHTFAHYIPVGKYFDEHPDWFPEIDGKRMKGDQLCLTNPEVVDFMVEQIRKELKANPGIGIVSVSQNDALGNCQCAHCKKIDEEEGTPMGSLLSFVNTVAERIEQDYPHVYIDTLAYTYTRRPPKHLRPRRNVIIRLCSIECSFSQPLDGPDNQAFADDLRGWAAIADNIYIWDYVATFTNFLRPHPNLRVLGPNLRFMAKNGVKGVFEEGTEVTRGGEFAELRSWMLARLMWNPEQDDRALIEEFVHGYYGKAAPCILDYIDMIHDICEQSNYRLGYLVGDPQPFVTCETMTRAEALFQQAEAAVADQPDVLNRVRRAHLSVQCMWVMHYDAWAKEARAQGLPAPAPYDEIFSAFARQVQADNVTIIVPGRDVATWLDVIKRRLAATVRASGNYGNMPGDAFDGDPQSAWNSGGFGPQWIQKDLGQPKTIKAITTIFPMSYYSSVTYKIEGSMDEQHWQTIVPEKIVTTGTNKDILPAPVEAQFVRTIILHAATPDHKNGWVTMSEQTVESE